MRKKTRKILIFTILAVFIFIVAPLMILHSISPKIVEYGNAQVKTQTTIAVNDAVLNTLSDFSYDDFVKVEKDSDGKVSCLTANSMLVNNLARIVVVAVEKELMSVAKTGVSMPLGNLSNMAIFTGIGPDLYFKLSPYQSVTCEFVSEFTSAGINQTRHRIILRVNTAMTLIVPTANTVITNTTDIILAETVLVGVVPNMYVDFD
ncbi:MAG TPA: sporulation protein YunB [Eubacteriales bacterium]|nr:sporulation protein YunB [Eubacteriales bacterium]